LSEALKSIELIDDRSSLMALEATGALDEALILLEVLTKLGLFRLMAVRKSIFLIVAMGAAVGGVVVDDTGKGTGWESSFE